MGFKSLFFQNLGREGTSTCNMNLVLWLEDWIMFNRGEGNKKNVYIVKEEKKKKNKN